MSGTTTIERYYTGEDARLRVRFYAEDGTTPIEATGVRVMVRSPTAASAQEYSGAAVIPDGTGSFYVDHRVTEAGRHRWRAECSGPTAAVDEGQFDGVISSVL